LSRWRGAVAAIALATAACGGRACGTRDAGPSPPPSSPAQAQAGNALDVLLVTIDTLRADHMGVYGYGRPTSPRIDAFAREAVTFDQAYSYWPKTRGSFVAMLTGRRDSQTGYGKTHQVLLEFNPTLASVLGAAGYRTAAVVDNANLSAQNGYAQGFGSYRETWQEPALVTEMDRTRAITEAGIAFLRENAGQQRRPPFFLWLHYVNPHAPYSPPPPWDTAFMDAAARSGPSLKVVSDFHGGIPRRWAVPGQSRLGYYVAQYDGEIAAVDAEVGRVLEALEAAGMADRTLVALTSDHGESLGEHEYFFDHGEDLFDPSLRVPLIVRAPDGRRGTRADVLASTLDLVPTVLDAVKVSYPPDLAGTSLLGWVKGASGTPRERLFARNDRNLSAAWDRHHKVVATPAETGPLRWSLYDRAADPGETEDVSRARPEEARVFRRELELFLERGDRERVRALEQAGEAPAAVRLDPDTCANLKSLGYADARCPD
jgi:arylsulfatase A-like enzyme